MTGKKNSIDINWDIILMATYFFLPFYGLRVAVENYLLEDNLGFEYIMLLSFVSAISFVIYLLILKKRELKVKLVGLGMLVILVIGINLMVP